MAASNGNGRDPARRPTAPHDVLHAGLLGASVTLGDRRPVNSNGLAAPRVEGLNHNPRATRPPRRNAGMGRPREACRWPSIARRQLGLAPKPAAGAPGSIPGLPHPRAKRTATPWPLQASRSSPNRGGSAEVPRYESRRRPSAVRCPGGGASHWEAPLSANVMRRSQRQGSHHGRATSPCVTQPRRLELSRRGCRRPASRRVG